MAANAGKQVGIITACLGYDGIKFATPGEQFMQTGRRASANLTTVIVEPLHLRLLMDPPLSGLENMARDEALQRSVGEKLSVPTMRLYQWIEPTLSLGYFQRYADYESLPPPAGQLPVVRRPTGGGAILHDMELTYSLALSADHRLLSAGPNRLYEWMHDAIIMALATIPAIPRRCGITDDSTRTRGPFFCFARRHCFDVTVDGAKLAGSAQRRTRLAVLQHGSIILGSRFQQQPTALIDLDPCKTITELHASLPRHFANLTGETVLAGEWLSDEVNAIPSLIEKHAAPEWLRRM